MILSCEELWNQGYGGYESTGKVVYEEVGGVTEGDVYVCPFKAYGNKKLGSGDDSLAVVVGYGLGPGMEYLLHDMSGCEARRRNCRLQDWRRCDVSIGI